MKILLAVDGSVYTKRMLSYLAAHAELLGSGHDYTVFTAVTPLPSHVGRFLDRKTLDDYYRQQAEEVLVPIRRFAEQQGWRIHTKHVAGHPAEEIAAQAESQKPDLIAMGTHGHSALSGVVLGSVTTGVLVRCKTPVLLIH